MPYLSTMLGTRVKGESGNQVGRLDDVAVVPGAKFPSVGGIVVGRGRAAKRRRFYVAWEDIKDWLSDSIVVKDNAGERQLPGEVFLARDLLDKQIVDMDGYKIVRVNDIRISWVGDELRVMGADVGLVAILRRLGLGGFLEKRDFVKEYLQDRIVPWHLVSPVTPMPSDVRLKVPYRKYLELHPSDVADIVEQLDEEQRAKVFAFIEDPKAAEVLTHILPDMRSSVAETMSDRRLTRLLEIMPPDEAADILGSLPRDKARVLLSLMGVEEASVVGELLGYDPETAGGRMTTGFMAIPGDFTASEAIGYLRRKGSEAETIYYVYVVDREGHLSGVLSLRDLLRSPPATRIEEIMTRDVITVDVFDDQEVAAEKLSRYNLLALPVVDNDGMLKGIVTVDDAIDVMVEESSEDFSQLSGVPFEEEGNPVSGLFDYRRWAATAFTLLGGILATAIFGAFRAEFMLTLALAYFIPLSLRSAHDISIWSLATAVRDLRGPEIEEERVFKVLSREFAYTLVAGAVIGCLCVTAGMILTESTVPAMAGGLGIFAGVAVSGLLGLSIPMFFRRWSSAFPAGAGRFFIATVMAFSVVVFLLVSGLIVRVWG